MDRPPGNINGTCTFAITAQRAVPGTRRPLSAGAFGGHFQIFDGTSTFHQLPAIKEVLSGRGVRSVLDYGSGKALLYARSGIELPDGTRAHTVRDYLGVDRIECYDPGVTAFSALPDETFDAVISVDVLEHCPQEDVPWILEEMFSRASKVIFATIAAFPAKKTLPNGENAHCTVKPASWWQDQVQRVAGAHPNVAYDFRVKELRPRPWPVSLVKGPRRLRTRITNSAGRG